MAFLALAVSGPYLLDETRFFAKIREGKKSCQVAGSMFFQIFF